MLVSLRAFSESPGQITMCCYVCFSFVPLLHLSLHVTICLGYTFLVLIIKQLIFLKLLLPSIKYVPWQFRLRVLALIIKDLQINGKLMLCKMYAEISCNSFSFHLIPLLGIWKCLWTS